MEAKNEKICPFNLNPCMGEECVLFDSEVGQCEFKDMNRFIGECFTELVKAIEDKDHD